MNSMTGFGKSEVTEDGRKLRVEIKSVNNRFLDINVRQPRFMMMFEELIRQYVKKQIIRGRVDVFVNYSSEREDAREVTTDMALAAAYVKAGRSIAERTGLENDLSISQLIRMPDVITYEESGGDEREMRALLLRCVDEALAELKKAREREGEKLKRDITARLQKLHGFSDWLEGREQSVVVEYKQKLEERLKELLDGAAVDEQRVAQEVAIYADKANITEEIVRIKSHVNQFLKLAGQNGAQGRNMDFIVQELNREFNTVGSKSQNVEIVNTVIEAKGEIEKIREQIQNIE